MRKSEDRKSRREQVERGDEGAATRRAGSRDDDAEGLPELSEQGGIRPVERNPGRYNDRTRDRTLDE